MIYFYLHKQNPEFAILTVFIDKLKRLKANEKFKNKTTVVIII